METKIPPGKLESFDPKQEVSERAAFHLGRIADAMEQGNALTCYSMGLIDPNGIQTKAVIGRTLQGVLDSLGKLHLRQHEEREAREAEKGKIIQ
jgi:hypothetical protein